MTLFCNHHHQYSLFSVSDCSPLTCHQRKARKQLVKRTSLRSETGYRITKFQNQQVSPFVERRAVVLSVLGIVARVAKGSVRDFITRLLHQFLKFQSSASRWHQAVKRGPLLPHLCFPRLILSTDTYSACQSDYCLC